MFCKRSRTRMSPERVFNRPQRRNRCGMNRIVYGSDGRASPRGDGALDAHPASPSCHKRLKLPQDTQVSFWNRTPQAAAPWRSETEVQPKLLSSLGRRVQPEGWRAGRAVVAWCGGHGRAALAPAGSLVISDCFWAGISYGLRQKCDFLRSELRT